MAPTIAIIEDEKSVAKGLIYGLEQEGYSVRWAASGQAGLELVRAESPELLILDLRLPDIGGYDVCRTLRAEKKNLPILILTASDQEMDKVLGLELGADDYLVKPFGFRELLSRIRALLRRAYGDLAAGSAEQWMRFGNVRIDTKHLQAFKGEEEIFLTPIEFKLLLSFRERPNQPIDRGLLIEQVWGSGYFLEDERTVDVHIRHLRQKLEPDPSRPRYIRTVRGFGYKFVPEDERLDVKKS